MNMNESFPTGWDSSRFSQNNGVALYYLNTAVALAITANVLLDDLESAYLGNTHFVKHAFDELKWMLDQSKYIGSFIDSFVSSNPKHPLGFSTKLIATQVHREIERVRSALNVAALDAINESSTSHQHRAQLRTRLYALHLSLQHLHNCMRQLTSGTRTALSELY